MARISGLAQVAALLVIVLGTVPRSASAEPITLPSVTAVMITPGELGRLNEVFLTLTGPGLIFSGEIDRSFAAASVLRPCGSCAPGTVANSSAAHHFAFNVGSNGFITVGDERIALATVETDLAVTSPGVTIPAPIAGVSEMIAPLTLTAR
jgi:hypothetical protein